MDKPNPFDPKSLRLDPSQIGEGVVRKLINNIAVRKPHRQEFVRVNPDPEYRLTPAALIELKEDRETFLVLPNIAAEVPGEYFVATIHTAVSRQGVLFLWPVRLPGSERKQNAWHQSAALAADCATKRWVRVTANMAAGYYETFDATAVVSEPEWPTLPMSELLSIAFRDRVIDSPDHDVIRLLRGAA
jgi:hypothetical protein